MKFTTTEGEFEPVLDNISCSIIIPVHNNVNFTKAAVTDLLRLPNDYEIVIVDNASDDSTQEEMASLIDSRSPEDAQLVYITCPRNLGFGRANNKGYKHSNGEYVLFLNNDIRVEKRHEDWPSIMLEWAKKGYLVGTQGGLLDKDFNFLKEGFGIKQSKYWYISGWCLCGSRENFDKLILNHYSHDETDEICEGEAWGPWNEKFFAYFEDGDLTWRARKLGIEFKEVHVPVHHFGRMTGKKLGLNYMYKKSRRIFKKMWRGK
ncbi:MAG: glycosyltransferase family 2 protein [Candidatus Hermodarchaeia archaeon]|jgi:GT2 family glycosyltransferase